MCQRNQKIVYINSNDANRVVNFQANKNNRAANFNYNLDLPIEALDKFNYVELLTCEVDHSYFTIDDTNKTLSFAQAFPFIAVNITLNKGVYDGNDLAAEIAANIMLTGTTGNYVGSFDNNTIIITETLLNNIFLIQSPTNNNIMGMSLDPISSVLNLSGIGSVLRSNYASIERHSQIIVRTNLIDNWGDNNLIVLYPDPATDNNTLIYGGDCTIIHKLNKNVNNTANFNISGLNEEVDLKQGAVRIGLRFFI